MHNYFLFAFFIISFISCDNKQSKYHKIESQKWETVMANHDVVMPMMGTTNKVRKGLKILLTDNPNLSEDKKAIINTLIQNLDEADEGMMDWMNGFQQLDKLRKTKEHQAILKYLDSQDVQIKKVGIDMTNSIQAGLDFLEKMGEQ